LFKCDITRHSGVKKKVKVKEADLYSAFIEVAYTQGTQVRITQCSANYTVPASIS